jgi:NitT/TauT family transport system substrate-binding protein
MIARGRAFLALLALAASALPAHANEALKIGSLKATNVGPAFIAKERGYFAAEGLDVDFIFFDSAQPVAVGVAAGSLEFGCTSISAGMYTLAGQGVLRIISGMYSEAPGFHNFGITVSFKAYAAGLTSYKDLSGHSVSISQVGSPVHYSLALVAARYGVDLASLRIEPLQGIPQQISALIGNTVDAAITNANALLPVVQAGQARLLGWVGDETPWQTAVSVTTAKMIDQHPKTVEAFLRAFKKGTRDYHDAFTGPGEKPQAGDDVPAMVAILAKYTGQTPEQVTQSIAYVDRDARLDVKDIQRQVAWFKSQKMLKDEIDGASVMDPRYVVALPAR